MGSNMISSEEFERQHPRDRVNRTGRFVKKPKPSVPDNKDLLSSCVEAVCSGLNGGLASNEESGTDSQLARVKWVTTITRRFTNNYSTGKHGVAQSPNRDYCHTKETWEEYPTTNIPSAHDYFLSIQKEIAPDIDKIYVESSYASDIKDLSWEEEYHNSAIHKAKLAAIPNSIMYKGGGVGGYEGVLLVDVRRVEAPNGVRTSKPIPVSKNKKPKNFTRSGLKILWKKDSDGRWLANADDSIEMAVGLTELAGKPDRKLEKQSAMLKGFIDDVNSGVLPAHLLPSVTQLINRWDSYTLNTTAPVDSDLDSLFEYICCPANQKSGQLTIMALFYAGWNRYKKQTPIWKCYNPSSELLLSCIKKTLQYDTSLNPRMAEVYTDFYFRRLPSTDAVEEELATTLFLTDDRFFRRAMLNRYETPNEQLIPSFSRLAENVIEKASNSNQTHNLYNPRQSSLSVLCARKMFKVLIDYHCCVSADAYNTKKFIKQTPNAESIDNLMKGMFSNNPKISEYAGSEGNLQTRLATFIDIYTFIPEPNPNKIRDEVYPYSGPFYDLLDKIQTRYKKRARKRGYYHWETPLKENLRDALHDNADIIKQSFISLDDSTKHLVNRSWQNMFNTDLL